MIIYFVCLLFWILFSVCCVAVGKNSRKNNSLNSPFTIFWGQGGGQGGGKGGQGVGGAIYLRLFSA